MKEQTGVLAEGQKEFPTSTGAAPVMPDAERNSQKMAEQLSVLQPEVVSSDIKVFGAVFNTYILIEYQDNLLLVDQHAVHERLLFDRMMREYKQPGLGQELLIPRIVSVSKQEQQLLTDNRELLEGLGMMLEPFGETDVAVRTMPILLGEVQPADFLRDVLGDLESGRALSFEYKRTALLQCACKHAIKGGEALTEDQLRDLVKQMTDRRVTPTCPHGRPLVVAISHRELDKKFKRIQ